MCDGANHARWNAPSEEFYPASIPDLDSGQAASHWVEKMLRQLPPPLQNQSGRMTKRNQSGYVGVSLSRATPTKRRRDTSDYWAWKANWIGCPNRGGVTFGIRTLGDRNAFVCAVLSRELRTVDRNRVLQRLARIKGTARYRAILKQKKQSAPTRR